MHEKNSIMKSKPIINLFINNSCKHNHCIHIYIITFFSPAPFPQNNVILMLIRIVCWTNNKKKDKNRKGDFSNVSIIWRAVNSTRLHLPANSFTFLRTVNAKFGSQWE